MFAAILLASPTSVLAKLSPNPQRDPLEARKAALSMRCLSPRCSAHTLTCRGRHTRPEYPPAPRSGRPALQATCARPSFPRDPPPRATPTSGVPAQHSVLYRGYCLVQRHVKVVVEVAVVRGVPGEGPAFTRLV